MAQSRPSCSSTSASTSIPDDNLVCPDCYLGYREFGVAYNANVPKLIEFCQNHGVILKEKFCDYCNSLCRLDTTSKCFRCDKTYVRGHKKRRRCNFKVSIFRNTWFSYSHVDIETNLYFVVLFLQDFFSYKFVQSELGLSKPTINDWASFCREVIVNWVFNKCGKIGGPGKTVEIDESKFGRRKYNVGRVVEGQWVFGGICRETRESFMVPVPDRTGDTLLAIIRENIEPGITIISDCWRAYDCLESEGYKHLKVNHSLNFVDPDTGAHTNTIERRWRDVKNLVPKYGRRKAHFVGYLSVSYFKLYYRDTRRRLHHFLHAAAKLYPPTGSA